MVRVELPTGAVIEVHVDSTTTVGELKRMLAEACGDPTRMRLSVAGVEVVDGDGVLEVASGGVLSVSFIGSSSTSSGFIGSTSGASASARLQPTTSRQPNMSNPLQNKLLHTLLSQNPDMLHTLLTSSPQFAALLKKSPQLRAALQNPAILDDLLAMMTDPLRYQEAMRSTDRAMSQMEMMPQGFQMLRQMHEQIEGVGFEAGGLGGSGSGGSSWGANKGGRPRRRLQQKALPNPWSASRSRGESDSEGDGE